MSTPQISIKQGGTFALECQLQGVTTSIADWKFYSELWNGDTLLDTFVCEVVEDTETSRKFSVTESEEGITENWPLGKSLMDVKIVDENDKVMYTEDIEVTVEQRRTKDEQ